ncbi:hypothetical protein DP175_07165 [Polynucleobacter paneuropaeus]|nr:hypothetical protein DP175_07165 [Polynucleobacter paneuropaeus]
MFVYAVSSPLFDRADPYWVCRLSALKVAYVGVVLFIVNAFFKSPTVPVLEMLVTAVAVAATELPPMNSRKKKILGYIGIVMLCVTTNSIFGLVSYFKWGLLIGVGVWALILYRLIAKDGLTANVVGILILIGIVSLEGDVATDLNGVINHALFYFEYAAAGLLALLLFPNLHDRVIKSAALRLIEADRQFIRGESNLIEFDDQTITSLLTLENQAAQVEPAIYGLMSFLKSLQIQIRGYSFGQKQNYKSLLEALDVIHHSISQSQAIEMDQLAHSTEILRGHKVAATLKDLAEYWNAQCLV